VVDFLVISDFSEDEMGFQRGRNGNLARAKWDFSEGQMGI